MATITKQTSLDKVQSVAVENGWNVHVGRATITIKDPAPADGVGYGYRRRYVPRVQAEVWEVTLDNLDALTDSTYEGVSYGQCRINVYFTDDGKYLAEATKSTGYHLYSDKPLREVLRVLEQLAPAKIQAHVLTRVQERKDRKAAKVAEAEQHVVDAQNDLDKARAAACDALAVLGVPAAKMDEALRTLGGPLMIFGLCQERRESADHALARVKADPYP